MKNAWNKFVHKLKVKDQESKLKITSDLYTVNVKASLHLTLTSQLLTGAEWPATKSLQDFPNMTETKLHKTIKSTDLCYKRLFNVFVIRNKRVVTISRYQSLEQGVLSRSNPVDLTSLILHGCLHSQEIYHEILWNFLADPHFFYNPHRKTCCSMVYQTSPHKKQ